ncbi:MAG: metallophosphoesterase [Ignavibacteriae bacterium]|nr:metallophosphoesterase [Ignavibacteriota bacterium]
MRIQYCSDLHLEFEQNSKYIINNPLPVNGDVLILAGDIIPLHDEYFNNSFFSFISENYKKVFWVPGNHEFYYKDINEFSKSFNIKLRININIVNNIDLHYENIQFVFSALWSKISSINEKNIEQSVSDFDCITNNSRKLKAKDFNKLHEECLSFIQQSLSNKKNKTVVVTHHLPSILCNSSVNNNSPINEAFCVDLTDSIEKSNVNFWIYGHSHFNQKPLYIGNTIMLTNQLGYVHYKEQASFKPNAYFTI